MPISHSSSHTALVIWIWFIRSQGGQARKRANSLMEHLGVEDGGTLMNSTGQAPSWLGWRRRSASSTVRPSCCMAVVFPVVAGPEMMQAASGSALLAAVEQQQAAHGGGGLCPWRGVFRTTNRAW